MTVLKELRARIVREGAAAVTRAKGEVRRRARITADRDMAEFRFGS
ncbi:hypothetical protein [Streptomyces canus]|nr:hypothetical protein [Streptomyces canus]